MARAGGPDTAGVPGRPELAFGARGGASFGAAAAGAGPTGGCGLLANRPAKLAHNFPELFSRAAGLDPLAKPNRLAGEVRGGILVATAGPAGVPASAGGGIRRITKNCCPMLHKLVVSQ
jgi:hypothetical protein